MKCSYNSPLKSNSDIFKHPEVYPYYEKFFIWQDLNIMVYKCPCCDSEFEEEPEMKDSFWRYHHE